MAKKWLSYQEQVSRLQERGLVVSDTYACESFLSEVSYYRFSGYFRYWQKNPKYGDDQFLDGINLETIENVMVVVEGYKKRPVSPTIPA